VKIMVLCILSFVAGLSASAMAQPGEAAAPVTSERVDAALDRMRKFLWRSQDGTKGSWETRQRSDAAQFGHTPALVTFALLESGEYCQNPHMAQALAFLKQQKGGDSYTAYPRLLCWALLPSDFKANLEEDTRYLLSVQQDGLFFNHNRKSDHTDHRALLYGLMALNAACDRSIPVPRRIWEQAADYLVLNQRRDGGWSFSDRKEDVSTPMGTVTCLTALHLCRHQFLGLADVNARITDAIQRGERYLNRNFELRPFVSSSGKSYSFEAAFHDLFLLERMTRYSGQRVVGGLDWLNSALVTVLDKEGGRGSINGDRVETAFALMVLSQARACAWINKLAFSNSNAVWDSRPEDLYRLTRVLSERRESDLHWHVISIDDPLRVWLNAPIAYLSTDQAVRFSDEQKGRLKRFLDLGGLLVANPENNAYDARQSFVALAHELYPAAVVEAVPDHHPLVSLLQKVTLVELDRVHNGVRDVILLPKRDLKVTDNRDSAEQEDIRSFFWNLYAWTTERGLLASRFEQTMVGGDDIVPTRRTRVGLVATDGSSPIEVMAWPVLSQWLLAHDKVEVSTSPTTLTQLSAGSFPFAHWMGVQRRELSAAELDGIEHYVRGGGTLLIETVGGMGDFASAICNQLENRLGAKAEHNAPELFRRLHRVGDPEPQLHRVVYRSFSVCQFGLTNEPRLQTISIDNRPAIIFSAEDLTLGMLGIKRWGIHGYRPDYARLIMREFVMAGATDRVPTQARAE